MHPECRPELLHIPEAIHGALDFAELERLGLRPEALLDFSVNGNPYGPSPRVREALAHVPYDRYPDREALALRRALAAHLEVPWETILVGNGSTELLWLVALAFLRPEDAVLIIGPTFGEYERAALLMGAHVHWYTAPATEGFSVDPEAVEHTIQQVHPRLVFVCNPNNPTGTLLTPATLEAWAAACPQAVFVVDEAYLTFAPQAQSVLPQRRANMLVLRSMTKAYALAGLRLGFAVGSPDILGALLRARPPWSVNAFAQAAGIAALEDQAHLAHCLAQIATARQALLRELHARGHTPVPSTTHFFLLPVPQAVSTRQALVQRGVLVRDCTSFGLPRYIRLATRSPEDNARLLTALAEIRT